MKRNLIGMLIVVMMLTLAGCNNSTGNNGPGPLTITKEIIPISLYKRNDAKIKIIINGGKSPYTLNWSNGSTNEDIVDLAPGTYIVTITDDDDNILKDTTEIEESIYDEITDYDGNVYQTVLIGDQWWTRSNLKSTHDSNGNPIQNYYYDDNEENIDNYGRLYTWETTMNGETTSGCQGIAPDGYHIPSRADWQKLANALGGSDIAGGKLKIGKFLYWNSPNTGATNSSKFNGKGSGERTPSGIYQFEKEAGVFWSSDMASQENFVHYFYLSFDNEKLSPISYYKTFAYSVRCVKNDD